MRVPPVFVEIPIRESSQFRKEVHPAMEKRIKH